MILRALLLLATSLAGLGTQARTAASPASAQSDTQLVRLASLQLKQHTSSRVLAWLRYQSPVRSAVRGADGKTLDIRFRDGMRAAILPASLTTVRVPTTVLRTHMRAQLHNRAPGGRALVLEPFATQLGLGPNVGDVEINDLRSAGFQVDQAYDTAVTVRALASLFQYNVVYMQTHSGLSYGGEGVVASGEPVGSDPSVAPLVQNGSVIPVAVSGNGALYYAITSRFITLYEGQFPPDSLVFFNGCNLLGAPAFWQALAAKGVTTLVSWDEEATSQDNYFAAAAFFTQMNQGLTVATAIAAAQAAGYGRSQVPTRGIATLGYLGDGTLTLQRAGGSSSTPTPVPSGPSPTSTPAAPVAQATPTPTPTRVPLPLSATLRPAVAPGAQQIIRITSSPDTILHISVTYPNGDHLVATTATDPSGAARFVYTQRPSEIMHGSRLARVTIQAIKGDGAATITKQYRVRFGVIDVSAEPRRQAAGRMIMIWVHTQPRTQVIIAIRPSRGTIVQRIGRSGPGGWLHARYRIPANLAPGSAVSVRARARIGSTVSRSGTMVRIT